MTAYGADVIPDRPFWVRAVVWGTFPNGTALVDPPKRFLTRRKASRWAVGRVLELEYWEARREFHRQMAPLSNGGTLAA